MYNCLLNDARPGLWITATDDCSHGQRTLKEIKEIMWKTVSVEDKAIKGMDAAINIMYKQ